MLRAFRKNPVSFWNYPLSVVVIMFSFILLVGVFSKILHFLYELGFLLSIAFALSLIYKAEQYVIKKTLWKDLGTLKFSETKIHFSKSEEVIYFQSTHRLKIHFEGMHLSPTGRFFASLRHSGFRKRHWWRRDKKREIYDYIEANGVRYNIHVFNDGDKKAFLDLIEKIRIIDPSVEITFGEKAKRK